MRNPFTVGLLPLLLLACNTTTQSKDPIEDRLEAKGKISIPLTATSTSGATYQIEFPLIVLEGNDQVIELDMTGQSEIELSLQEGEWSLFIDDGWALYLLDGEEAIPVEAELIGENPQLFDIEGGETTYISIQFQTIGDTVDFHEGNLEINVTIDDSETEEETTSEEEPDTEENPEEPEIIDQDGDGYDSTIDCDDTDASLGDIAQDADCDGVLVEEDCNDNDPDMPYGYDIFLEASTQDLDCDGYPAHDDCNDNDPSSTNMIEDLDCDGVLFWFDCDDDDPSIGQEEDCEHTPW